LHETIVTTLGNYRQRMIAALQGRAVTARQRLSQLAERRCFRRPQELLHDRAQRLDELWARSGRSLKHRLQLARGRVEGWAGKLESLSPLGVLSRGYSVTQRADDGTLVTDASTLKPGDLLRTRLAIGEATSRVEEARNAELGARSES
jgi:exodeoxyribonuclease VII large subunit